MAKTIPVMYHGERVNILGKIYQCFKSKDGKEFNFSGIKRVWFGSVYEMLKEGRMSVRPKEIEAAWEPSESERREYEANKIVVRGQRQRNLKAMKIKKPHENIVRAVELLRPFYVPLGKLERTRFMEWFENECSRPRRKR